jgi:hypothetical protein
MTLTLSSASTVENLVFNFSGYSFNLIHNLTITGNGITGIAPSFELPGANLTFTNSSTAGPAIIHASGLFNVEFLNSSKAGTAKITAGVAGSNDDFTGGFVMFHNNSTAANATITAFVGSNIEFHDASTAGTATLTAGNATIPADAGDNGSFFSTRQAPPITPRLLLREADSWFFHFLTAANSKAARPRLATPLSPAVG